MGRSPFLTESARAALRELDRLVAVPHAVHEAVRDLMRTREAAANDLRRKRQQLLSFLLHRGRIYKSIAAAVIGPDATAVDNCVRDL